MMMKGFYSILLHGILSIRGATIDTDAAAAISINPHEQVPHNASDTVDPSFVGFGVEASSFPDYTGTSSKPNKLSQNLLQSLSNRTGAPVFLRVGGTSLDHSVLDLSQKVPAKRGAPGFSGLSATFGPSFFDAYGVLPDTKYIINLPFAAHNLSYAIEFTRRALAVVGTANKLDSIELGNEPQRYAGHDRPKDFDLADYVAQWEAFTHNISSKLSLPNKPIFQALALGSNAFHSAPNFSVIHSDTLGLFKASNKVKSVSQHYYQSNDDHNIDKTLMNHTATKQGVNERFKAAITHLKNNHPEIDFVLGEVGSSLDTTDKNRTDNTEFEASLGTTMWTIDWMLYSMSIGIKRVNVQLGNPFTFAPWHPTASDNGIPQIRAPYYGHVFVADFIGKDTDLRVKEFPTGSPRITAYAGYKGGKLAKLAVVNQEVWTDQFKTPRPSKKIQVKTSAGSVQVRRLTGPGTGALSGLLWEGLSWTADNNGFPVRKHAASQTIKVVNNLATVHLNATEALLMTF